MMERLSLSLSRQLEIRHKYSKKSDTIHNPTTWKQPQPFWSTPLQAFSGSGHLDPREESTDTVTTLEIR